MNPIFLEFWEESSKRRQFNSNELFCRRSGKILRITEGTNVVFLTNCKGTIVDALSQWVGQGSVPQELEEISSEELISMASLAAQLEMAEDLMIILNELPRRRQGSLQRIASTICSSLQGGILFHARKEKND